MKKIWQFLGLHLKLLPTLFIAFLPFELFDQGLLNLQFKLKSQKKISSSLWVVQVGSEYSATTVALNLLRDPNQKCFNLLDEPTNLEQCLDVPIRKFFSLDEVLSQGSIFSSFLNQEKKWTAHKIHFTVDSKNLRFQSIEEALGQLNFNRINANNILVLVPANLNQSLSLNSPFGLMPREIVALNLLSNVVSGVEYKEASLALRLSIALICWVVVIFALARYPTFFTLILIFILSTSLWGLSLFLLEAFAFHLKIAGALMVILTTYLLGLSDRLDRNERKQWGMEVATENLKKLDVMRSHFVSLVSHDLKTPIAKIQVLLEQLLSGHYGALAAEQKEQLEKLLSANGQLKRSVSSILLLNRVESNEVELKREPTDIQSLLEKVIALHESGAKEKNIRIEKNFEPCFLIELDPALIAEVLHNLLDNALRYSPQKSTLKISCGETEHCPYLSPPQAALWIEILDQGPGIPESERAQIFQKFIQGQSADKTEGSYKGSGLGLFLSHFFVKKHEGTLDFVSHVETETLAPGTLEADYFKTHESGTVFRIFLPLDVL